MIIKSMFAMLAVAVSLTAVLPAEKAEARTNFDINIGIGTGAGYFGPGYDAPVFPGPAYDDDHFEIVEDDDVISCREARNIVRLNGFRNISIIDCSGPNYRFAGWRNGHRFAIKVNGWGEITRIRRR